MSTHFSDRLIEAVERCGAPICVGIDPVVERLPPSVLAEYGIEAATGASPAMVDSRRIAQAFVAYGRGLINSVSSLAPVVKINVAFFERYHVEGLRAYLELIRLAHQAGLLVIGDVKRADIGHTSEAYAAAQLGGSREIEGHEVPLADAITINPYFGTDGVKPFVDCAAQHGRGVFVLVQTSNDSAAELQNMTLANGALVSEHVAKLVDGWSNPPTLIGRHGFSCVGAVVSPRDREATERLRKSMPHCLFLVPGFGAQGRTADEVALCFREDGRGAIVNASRSVGFAYSEPKYSDRSGGDWRRCIQDACRDFHAAVRAVIPGRG